MPQLQEYAVMRIIVQQHPHFFSGEAQERSHDAGEGVGDVMQCVLRRAAGDGVRGAGVEAVFEDI